jgi:hypothetical protein
MKRHTQADSLRIARSAAVDALLDRLEQLSARDWRTVHERFIQHSDAEWTKINAVLLAAGAEEDPYEGLSEQASERMSEELSRQIGRVKRVAEQVLERAAGDSHYRSKLEFAIGRLAWLERKRDYIRSEKGKRAVAVVDGLFEGLLPGVPEGVRESRAAERTRSTLHARTARASSGRGRRPVSATYDRLVTVWDGIEPRLLARGGERRLTHGERLVHELFFRLDSEVRNGGVEQYLSNAAGDGAERAKAYLAEIGAWPTLEVLDEVSALFPRGEIPANRRRRVRLLDKMESAREDFSNPLGEADERYAHAQEELYARILDYVKAYANDFASPQLGAEDGE